ncbi:ParB/RepB/Spo0J family partition protein [Cognatiluteimonas profundi]|uniref:ParB/RepB/Spo0J family partition protein n=1 Tax=Cognatiluteimonas profundi TaxID=2594501 RepID=UPI00131DB913|nr:ParB/RepB/Spo0J family partition protein [Lysobacter profundi]
MELRQVPIADIKTHPALQPRDPALLKQREQLRQEQQSELHVHDMAQLLKADPRADLVPLQVAEVDGGLYVVDGHHRLRAYRRAKRETVPAKVQAMTLAQASHASKLANITHTKLEMRPPHKRNALWHHLAAITHQGSLQLPKGVSQRSLQGHFGVSLDTVQRMLRRLPEVDPTKYPEEHCDGITRWPHWRYVCRTVRSDMYQAMTPDARVEWEAQKYLRKLLKLWEQTDRRALEAAHWWLLRDAEDEDDKALAVELQGALKVSFGGDGIDDF